MSKSQPFLLIAMPQMTDPRFFQSVVLILQHDDQGAFGWILNRQIDIGLEAFALGQGIPCHSIFQGEKLGYGGPVEPERGWVFHRLNQQRAPRHLDTAIRAWRNVVR